MTDDAATAPVARRWHVLGFVLLTAAGLYALAVSLQLGLSRQGSPGEGLFPFITALGMTLFSLAALAGAWRARNKPAAEIGSADLRGMFLRVGAYLAALIFYAAALDALGFIISTIATVVFILRYAESYSWRATLALAIGTVVGCELLFVFWLGAILPTGFVWDTLLYGS